MAEVYLDMAGEQQDSLLQRIHADPCNLCDFREQCPATEELRELYRFSVPVRAALGYPMDSYSVCFPNMPKDVERYFSVIIEDALDHARFPGVVRSYVQARLYEGLGYYRELLQGEAPVPSKTFVNFTKSAFFERFLYKGIVHFAKESEAIEGTRSDLLGNVWSIFGILQAVLDSRNSDVASRKEAQRPVEQNL